MRFLARVTIPKDKGHEAAATQALAQTIQSAMQTLNPEAAYFIEDEGKRECLLVFNLQALLMPLFLDVQGSLVVTPVMNAAEFQHGLGTELGDPAPATRPDMLDDISPVPSGAPGSPKLKPHRPDPAKEIIERYYP